MKFLKNLSSIKALSLYLFWLMAILIIGTIEQKSIGLFASQQKYFYSLFFKYHYIYLPGGGLTLGLFTVSLLSQLSFKTSYKNKQKIGIALTHAGALILMIGAIYTNVFGIEGSLVFKEGETKSYFLDYRKYSIVITDPKNQQIINEFNLGLQNNLFKIHKFYRSCEFIPNPTPKHFEVGFAKMFIFKDTDGGDNSTKCLELFYQDKLLRIFTNMPRKQTLEYKGNQAQIELINSSIKLPFQIKLIDFQKEFHQGTMLSKSFKSFVEISDQGISSNHLIEMNQPLRYKGYTFYQSSFSENSDGEISELAVVKNEAAIVPYIATIIIFFGLFIHVVINFRKYFYE